MFDANSRVGLLKGVVTQGWAIVSVERAAVESGATRKK